MPLHYGYPTIEVRQTRSIINDNCYRRRNETRTICLAKRRMMTSWGAFPDDLKGIEPAGRNRKHNFGERVHHII